MTAILRELGQLLDETRRLISDTVERQPQTARSREWFVLRGDLSH
jgi:hypothetical protein